MILACTDLTMSPEEIIELYCLRFKIETCFRAYKQTLSGFVYHFWSKSMPKLNRFKKNEDAQKELEKIHDTKQRADIVSAFKAIEGFVMCCCIALGLLQMCSLKFGDKTDGRLWRWLRTYRGEPFPSEATIADFLRKTISRATKKLTIMRLIRNVQDTDFLEEDIPAS